ncbi:rRNA methylase [Sutcliffiella horikoshii]|uniref:rRNA methylase n=1 Tax=Sutcliffiella horikoshii TaxID=79883 RepID=UPI001F416A99
MPGYRVVKGSGIFNHSFGGDSWTTPICPNCKTNSHLIFCFNLTDSRLNQIYNRSLKDLPLVSCLNCSSYWERQVFKIDPVNRKVNIVKQIDNERWVSEEEDRLPYPLPVSAMTLQQFQKVDTPSTDEPSDLAFEAFGSEYVCRILGKPLYAVDNINKNCECCNNPMEYVATICSEDFNSEGLVHENFSFNFGESFLYFYLCKVCNILETEMQST